MSSSDPLHRPSLRDIARALGMSHVAVSLALRGSSRVSAARREEVKAMAEKLGYRPDPMLASLVAYRQGKRPSTISSCLGWINQWDPSEELRAFKEFDRYWQGACEAAEKLGYRLEEFRWPMGKSGKRLQAILQTREVRGLLIPPHRNGLDLPDFDWSQFSVVRFGSSVSWLRAHLVTSDQSHCSRLAYAKSWELGYRRIGYLSEATFEKNTHGHFCEGYLNARQSTPRGQVETLILSSEVRNHSKELAAWLEKEKPDAVITTYAIRPILDAIGVRVPRDIAVATTSVLDGSFDTGVDQNSFEIGRVGGSALAGLILGNERGLPDYQRRILVEGRWVAGTSMPGVGA
jgi:DNA-binding LacI/PurR family transcriptional regulator